MNISINGNSQSFDSQMSLTQLLNSLGLTGKPVVIELNKQAIFPRQYEETQLNDGDQVEIITIAAGG